MAAPPCQPEASSVFVVLPVYNEAESLGPLLERFESVAVAGVRIAKVIVVDDGSSDESLNVARGFEDRLPLEIVRHSSNQGLGPTIQDGLTRAAEHAGPHGVIVSMDADNTHPPELIPAMLAALSDQRDVVIASRYRPAARVEGLSATRVLASYGARFLFQVMIPVPRVRDYTCGFRAYRARTLQVALEKNGRRLTSERGFACMADILLSLVASGARCGEVPFVLNYDRKGGPSKMNVPRTALGIFKLALRWRLRGFEPKH